MAQTPAQRRANAKYAKSEEAKRGRNVVETAKRSIEKSPISKVWLGLLAFVVIGGIFFEVIRLFF